tara:strand:+ start:591 stop:1109 length:519 start_codon:yes stop_codon:yes gene_type:complete
MNQVFNIPETPLLENNEPEKVKKPKRILSEKQQASLALGRKRMAEKRKEEKKVIREEKELANMDLKGYETNQYQTKNAKERKKDLKIEQLKIKTDMEQKKIKHFKETKSKIMEKITDINTYKKMTSILDDITPEDIISDYKLKQKLMDKLIQYNKEQKVIDGIDNTISTIKK